ncbi:MAG: riboflavin synthase [Cyclobacteriaceae bacterium]|nr:riboflavin synthase [Cyclobacteriaceae bacterium]
MFTGIIESQGVVKSIEKEGSNVHFKIESSISSEVKVDQSVAHDGVCLTVTRQEQQCHWVTAIDETIKRSTLGVWKPGTLVNLERCMLNNGRFDGHIVQGHVDTVGEVLSVSDEGGSWLYKIGHKPSENPTVEKGSVTVNGISLTCFNSETNAFSVAIIPYTYEHTNFKALKVGDKVNLEFDIIGKYVKKLLEQKEK